MLQWLAMLLATQLNLLASYNLGKSLAEGKLADESSLHSAVDLLMKELRVLSPAAKEDEAL